jgi:hypothetical protein
MSGDVIGVNAADRSGTKQGKFHHGIHLFAHIQSD